MASRTSSTSRNIPVREHELRARIAIEAARLISESGLRDYQLAKRKAADRLGVGDDFALPKNSEIDAALRQHQRLFHPEEQSQQLRRLRETAVEAMRFFFKFEPRLVGAVLEGTADRHSPICLHLFCDDPDAPASFLNDQGIAFEEKTRRLHLSRDEFAEFPAIEFAVDAMPINLIIFAYDDLRQAPLDRIDAKPMRRSTLAALQELLK